MEVCLTEKKKNNSSVSAIRSVFHVQSPGLDASPLQGHP